MIQVRGLVWERWIGVNGNPLPSYGRAAGSIPASTSVSDARVAERLVVTQVEAGANPVVHPTRAEISPRPGKGRASFLASSSGRAAAF